MQLIYFFSVFGFRINDILKTKINIRIRTVLLTKSIIRRKNFLIALILVILILLISLAFSSYSAIPEKKEFMFINDAVKKAKTANKLLIIEFWDPECGSCLRLNNGIFENESTRKFLDENFLIVKVSPADSVYTTLRKHFNLNYQNSVIFMDINGNEIDRTVSYDGNRDSYLSFLKEVSEGRNLYCQVFMAYKKDTMDVRNNFLLAKKLLLRHQLKDAIDRFNKVILLDPRDAKGYNKECKQKIAESILILKHDPNSYQKPHLTYP